ncbi:SH2 domain [Phytophthora infestans]|uniref:SH2 domain n=1 Tax=Phytophthora infestans TaxID=4787 RepID=A0A8S9UXK5_PHYIN|nr:SH2 domain [Phytophthora infestans]
MHSGGPTFRHDGDVGDHDGYPPANTVAHTLQYTPSARLKIFLSYGHDRFQALAFHLKAALQRRGHVVWLDIEKLSAGIDWEEGIAGGLSWVRDAGADGRVLLIMTPHALRRPDGYCLNEVARAASLRLNIFPVMVAESAPPPSIAMLPFFDMRDCVPEDVEHAKDSQAWQDRMKSCLETSTFLDKAERLYTVLELFESITSYGVPAVTGLANLRLFPGFDDPHLDTPRSSSVRRLLSLSPTRGRSASLDVPPEDDGNVVTNALSSVDSNEAAALEASLTTRTEVKEEENGAVSCRSTRYVLSYDESCYVLALRIYQDLTDSGYAVFPVSSVITMEDASSGLNSREDALQWASAERDGKLILLLTAESVGRPHGVSLNDVSAAMSAGLGFVPLLVRSCEIPLSICRIQWLDMTDCLVYSGDGFASLNRVRYESRREQLVAALEGTLDHEGQQTRLFSLLSPFSFQRQISHLTETFVGREWLFQLFQRWVQGSAASTRELSNQRVFWVIGQIGSGKSSVAACMVQACPEIAAFHFATQEDEQTHNARRCVLSLAYQLTTQLPEYAHYLQSHEPLEEMVPVASFVELVTHLLIGPLNAIARPSKYKSLVLLIDGVEWLLPASCTPVNGGSWRESKDEECLVSMLPMLVSRLPEWVRIVLLSREEPPVLSKLHAFDPPDVIIEQFKLQNDQDIRRFISSSLSKLNLSDVDFEQASAQIGSGSDTGEFGMEQVVELIARRSEGLFLYAVNVVQAISEGRLRLHELAELPVGMGAYLHQFFASHFADHDVYKHRIRPVLEVCCAAYEPLPLATLARVLEWDVYEQRDAAAMLGSLFSIEAGHDPEAQLLRPFHSSVLDWVRDSNSSGVFFVDVASGHERLGRWAAREHQTLTRSNVSEFVNLNYELEATGDEKLKAKIYIVRNACNHLMQATGEDCMRLVAAFAADEKFQLARRLLHVRAEGLQSFFHGDISREKAQELLARRQPHRVGSFLIRYTARQRTYCASFVAALDDATGAPKFRHNLIHHLENGSYSTVPPAEVTEKTILYPDLISFVEQYQRKGVLTAPVARDVPLNREISR